MGKRSPFGSEPRSVIRDGDGNREVMLGKRERERESAEKKGSEGAALGLLSITHSANTA